jgi:hypothetical protein
MVEVRKKLASGVTGMKIEQSFGRAAGGTL